MATRPGATLTDDNTATFDISIDDAHCFAIIGELGEVTTIMGTALPSLTLCQFLGMICGGL
jgi:hypothetical protein